MLITLQHVRVCEIVCVCVSTKAMRAIKNGYNMKRKKQVRKELS